MKESNKQFDDVKSSIHTEALKLADKLDGLNSCEPVIIKACEDMLRRLVEELDKQTYKADLLENRLKVIVGSKPLSDEEILDIWYDFNDGSHNWTEYIKFARTIEERHGIK